MGATFLLMTPPEKINMYFVLLVLKNRFKNTYLNSFKYPLMQLCNKSELWKHKLRGNIKNFFKRSGTRCSKISRNVAPVAPMPQKTMGARHPWHPPLRGPWPNMWQTLLFKWNKVKLRLGGVLLSRCCWYCYYLLRYLKRDELNQ